MKRELFVGAVLGLIVISGCKSTSSSNSKIVAEVEAAGSGKLDDLDEGTIQNWLAKHDDVAGKVGPECKTVMTSAPANWAATTEGRVCTAVKQVLFYKTKDLTDGHY